MLPMQVSASRSGEAGDSSHARGATTASASPESAPTIGGVSTLRARRRTWPTPPARPGAAPGPAPVMMLEPTVQKMGDQPSR